MKALSNFRFVTEKGTAAGGLLLTHRSLIDKRHGSGRICGEAEVIGSSP